MIHKYLVCSASHVFLSSVKQELMDESYYIADLQLPLDIFWELKSLLREADYKMSSGEDQLVIKEIYQKVFKAASQFAAAEKDRLWLLKNSRRPES